MRKRLATALARPQADFGLLPPAASTYISSAVRNRASETTNFVMLSGVATHKNLWRLYELVNEMLRHTDSRFTFSLTVSEERFKSHLRESHVDPHVIARNFRFLGEVDPHRVQQVYNNADFAVNLSDLESFSNNYLEAWTAGVPIIASDRDFARHICQDSALFVDPHDVSASAPMICSAMHNEELKAKLVRRGRDLIKEHPNNRQRYLAVWDHIQAVLQSTEGSKEPQ